MKIVFKFNKRQALALLGLALVGAVLRLATAPRVLVDGDGVDFALALSRFNPLHHQPHFPIYPVFIAVARLFAWLPAPLALAVPGALGGALMVAATGWLLLRRGRPTAAWLAATQLAVTPALVAVGGQAGSDGLGLGLTLAGACLAVEHAGLGGLLLGLALGARPSYLPLIAPLVVAIGLARRGITPGARGVAVARGIVGTRGVAVVTAAGAPGTARAARWLLAGVAAGVALWLVPLVAAVGVRALWALATTHTAQHLDRFATATGLGERGAALSATLAQAAWPALLVLVAALARRRSRAALSVLALVAPYALWVWLAQNAEHARHAAPLVAALMLAAALAAGDAWADAPRRRRAQLAAAWLAVAVATTSFPAVAAWRAEAVARIRAELGSERVLVAGTSLPRVAAWYAPELRTARAVDGRDVARLAHQLAGVRVVVSSELAHLEGVRLAPLATVDGAQLYLAEAP